ncbi:MAG: Mismatch repair protein msh3 [Caeruleum heppii]|nr:MAG: Mismatch repair protein msh3 [Caeruleum heppii]
MPAFYDNPAGVSSTKKQRSISAFFTPKAVSTPNRAPTKTSDHFPSNDHTANGISSQVSPSATAVDDVRGVLPSSPPDSLKRGHDDEREGDDTANDASDSEAPASKRSKTGRSLVVPRVNASNRSVTSETDQSRSRGRLSDRTAKYLFSPSSPTEPTLETTEQVTNDVDDTEEIQTQKKELHERFVKKLGHPDSIARLRRRNTFAAEGGEDEAEDGNEDDEGDAEQTAPKKASAKAGKKGGAAEKLTPMLKQVLEIKRQHMDTLLVVEVGYKFRFFGEDARIAAKELSIMCIPGKLRFDEHHSEAHLDRFASASIPVHRLHVHVRRLVAAGHKVGVVRQLETAALKAVGDNRNKPFERKLTNLYTKGTFVDDAESLQGLDGPSGGAPATGYLLCITESNSKGWGTDEKVHVGIIAVQPATGDVIYDDFEDGFMRSEIETRLLHIAPCELLIVGELSHATEKLLQHLTGSSTTVFGDKVRVERVDKPKTMAAQAFSHVSTFYAQLTKSSRSQEGEGSANLLEKVLKLSEHVTSCLSAMITHMKEYGLEHVFDLTKYFQSFSARSHMLLNGNTLNSLELYRNQTDYSEKGSLFWTLDQTYTRFGHRLLRKWVGRPLLDKAKLEERIAAVEELKDASGGGLVSKLKNLLSKVKVDLEKSLIRIYYGKCTRPELLNVLQTLQRIANEFAFTVGEKNAGFASDLINTAISALPEMGDDVVQFLDKINPEAAKSDDKYAFFREGDECEEITEQKLCIASVEHDLEAHRAVAAEKLRKKRVDYVTCAGIEYLIELDNTQLKNVPASWPKISATKKISRFHTPEVIKLLRERDQSKEALAAACDAAFARMLSDIAGRYQSFRDCVQYLATLDCLMALAAVAARPGYVKPEYVQEAGIAIEGGRHPMVEQLLLDAYVPNDTNLSASEGETRALLITGPNMGGKSSYVRQIALIAIMGQIGSYVPATSARLGMLDAVFTRMGAFDNMMAGESTFMVELSETSDILKQATSRSLVILDELGRGTSTHDGVAIAQAVLNHVVREVRCLTLFVTHYQALAAMEAGFEDRGLKNVHMRFNSEMDKEEREVVTFLYEVGEGMAHRSYGLNVARLAQVPEMVLDVASVKSRELEVEVRGKKLAGLVRLLDNEERGVDLDQLVTGISQL